MPLNPSYFTRNEGTDQANPTQISLIRKNVFTNVTLADDNGFSVSHAGAGTAGTTNQTLGGALCTAGVGVNDVARNVVIVVTHGTSVVAMSGTITGTDRHGRTMTEAWSVTATGTTKTFTGKKAFKTVTKVTETIAADASANTIITGQGIVLGLDRKCATPSLLKEAIDGAIVTTGTVVAAGSASTADAYGTYLPATAPDGAHDWEVWFLVDDFYTTPAPTA